MKFDDWWILIPSLLLLAVGILTIIATNNPWSLVYYLSMGIILNILYIIIIVKSKEKLKEKNDNNTY